MSSSFSINGRLISGANDHEDESSLPYNSPERLREENDPDNNGSDDGRSSDIADLYQRTDDNRKEEIENLAATIQNQMSSKFEKQTINLFESRFSAEQKLEKLAKDVSEQFSSTQDSITSFRDLCNQKLDSISDQVKRKIPNEFEYQNKQSGEHQLKLDKRLFDTENEVKNLGVKMADLQKTSDEIFAYLKNLPSIVKQIVSEEVGEPRRKFPRASDKQ